MNKTNSFRFLFSGHPTKEEEAKHSYSTEENEIIFVFWVILMNFV